MDRFKKILVAASPGHLESMTLRAAVKLAAANNAHLTVLDVVPPLPRFRKSIAVEGRVIDVEAALLQDRTERLRHLAANVQASEDTDVVVKTGEPFIEVIRHVLEHDNDLVMVCGSELAKGETPEFGSGVMHLLRKCPVPVWLMRPSRARKLRILALVDPDPGDPVRDGLNELVWSWPHRSPTARTPSCTSATPGPWWARQRCGPPPTLGFPVRWSMSWSDRWRPPIASTSTP